MTPYAIGIDVGATNVKGITVSMTCEVLARRSIPMRDGDLATVVREFVTELQTPIGVSAQWLGLAAPGIADPAGRSIWWMQGRLAEVAGLDWSKLFGRPVPVLNDAQAALLGEVFHGAEAEYANVIMLTLGTGVGGAAIVDGELLRGRLGRAGHLGHISLDPEGAADIVNTPGSLEDAIGDCTIGRRSEGRYHSTLELVRRLDDCPQARQIWSKSIRALACGIASLVNVLDPSTVILGGGIVAAGEKLFAPLRAEMDKVEWRPHGQAVRIVPAAAGEYAGAIGAAWNAMNRAKLTKP